MNLNLHLASPAAILLGISILGCSRNVTLEGDLAAPSVDATGVPEVRLLLVEGTITVESSTDGSIAVSAHCRATGKGEAAARKRLDRIRLVPAREADGTLRVGVDGPEGADWSADIVARVPANVRISAETGRGSVHLRDRQASVRAASREGDVEVDANPSPGSRVELDSARGSVTCRVPRFLAAHYSLRVDNGALRADSAPFRVPPGATSFSATTGPDAVSIHIHAANGDIRVEGT